MAINQEVKFYNPMWTCSSMGDPSDASVQIGLYSLKKYISIKCLAWMGPWNIIRNIIYDVNHSAIPFRGPLKCISWIYNTSLNNLWLRMNSQNI